MKHRAGFMDTIWLSFTLIANIVTNYVDLTSIISWWHWTKARKHALMQTHMHNTHVHKSHRSDIDIIDRELEDIYHLEWFVWLVFVWTFLRSCLIAHTSTHSLATHCKWINLSVVVFISMAWYCSYIMWPWLLLFAYTRQVKRAWTSTPNSMDICQTAYLSAQRALLKY